MEDLILNGALIFGTVWGGVKFSMNGVYKKLDRQETKIDSITTAVGKNTQRLVRVETKLEDWERLNA